MKECSVFKRNIPNLISMVRILGTVCLLFLEPLSIMFYIIYTVSGISDALDGWLARHMKLESALGARLDSVADLLFYAVMLTRIFPVMWIRLPKKIWIIVGIIIGVRLCSYVVAACKYKCFASIHTYMNKLTGAAVFLIPYFLLYPAFVPYSVLVCVIALLASAEELLIHLHSNKYSEDIKSIHSL